ncbi:hypothetical protein ACFV0T_32205 [Streptomyces sp. NPDC059582]
MSKPDIRNYFNMYLWEPALITAGVIPERGPGSGPVRRPALRPR